MVEATEELRCRLCDENNDKMYNVFEKSILDVEIINLIQECLPILIYAEDPLSKYICHSCNENLNMFYEFKKTCMEIAKKHKDDLEANVDRDPAVEAYLSKINAYVDSENLGHHHEEHHISTNIPSVNTINSDTMEETAIKSEANDIIMTRWQCKNDCALTIKTKPRITGPRSIRHHYEVSVKSDENLFHPLTLLELAIQAINVQNIPDVPTKYFKTTHVERLSYRCRYCHILFEQEAELSKHELKEHIKLHITRVDEGRHWDESQDEHRIRNDWMEIQSNGEASNAFSDVDSNVDVEDVGDEDVKDLLVPFVETTNEAENPQPPEVDFSRNTEVYHINGVPHAKGLPLKDIPKEVRNTFYASIKLNGYKKKLCKLCRYTFKDNWSIDNHYLQKNCCTTCYYCGTKFKRNAEELPMHIQGHVDAGHEKSMNVFVLNDRSEVVEVDTNSLNSYVPINSYATRSSRTLPPKTSTMRLRLRQTLTPPVQLDQSLSPPPKIKTEPVERKGASKSESIKNEAYFCKQCYLVFTTMGEYNTHMAKTHSSNPIRSNLENNATSLHTRRNITKKMPALTPLPIPPTKIKQENGVNGISTAPVETYPCNYCSAIFKSVYSRNSHMRMHVKNKPKQLQPIAPKPLKRPATSPTVQQPAKKMKHENFEPIVEIHEGATTTIGSVSITPLKKTSSGMSPDLMKLVQNNPNITIKPRAPIQTPNTQYNHIERVKTQPSTPTRPVQSSDDSDSGKGYKCASCNQMFANKSNLYFHKKDQCTGSRFPCPFCKKRFGTGKEYSAHIYYSHPE